MKASKSAIDTLWAMLEKLSSVIFGGDVIIHAWAALAMTPRSHPVTQSRVMLTGDAERSFDVHRMDAGVSPGAWAFST